MLEGLGLRPVARRKLRVFGGDIYERCSSRSRNEEVEANRVANGVKCCW